MTFRHTNERERVSRANGRLRAEGASASLAAALAEAGAGRRGPRERVREGVRGGGAHRRQI
jgi:hypothetical protein